MSAPSEIEKAAPRPRVTSQAYRNRLPHSAPHSEFDFIRRTRFPDELPLPSLHSRAPHHSQRACIAFALPSHATNSSACALWPHRAEACRELACAERQSDKHCRPRENPSQEARLALRSCRLPNRTRRSSSRGGLCVSDRRRLRCRFMRRNLSASC